MDLPTLAMVVVILATLYSLAAGISAMTLERTACSACFDRSPTSAL